MTIGASIFYIFLVVAIALIFWRIRTNPITQIRDGVINDDIRKVRQSLEKGVNVDVEVFGGTPLYLAVSAGNQEMVKFLVNRGADINQGLNEENGKNPLLEAAVENHPELVEFFLARGAIVGIHFAALTGDIDAVRNFIEQKVFINPNRWGKTPLNLAIKGGHKEIVSLLLDNGADISFYSMGGRPLDCAIRYNRLEIAEFLIERGANINYHNGSHPLRLAISQNKLEMVELLFRKGVDINSFYPLHLAASEGHLDIAKFLLANGFKINARDKDGTTPLHLAASKDCLEMTELLIRNGAEVNSMSWFGLSTPLAVAQELGYEEMANLLKSYGAK